MMCAGYTRYGMMAALIAPLALTCGSHASEPLGNPATRQIHERRWNLPEEFAPVVAFAPDGQEVVFITRSHTGGTINTADGRIKTRLACNDSFAMEIGFLPGARSFASAGGRDSKGRVRVWDTRSGQLKTTVAGPDRFTSCLAASPDGKVVALGCGEGVVKLLDLVTHREVASLEPADRKSGHVLSLAFSPNGKYLAAGSGDDQVRVWDVKNAAVTTSLPMDKDTVSGVAAVAYSPDGNILAAGSREGEVRLWSVQSGKVLAKLESEATVCALAFSPDGKLLASGTADKTVCIWDVKTRKLSHTLKGHTSQVNSVAFAPDGKTLASGSWDETIRLWSLGTGLLLWTAR